MQGIVCFYLKNRVYGIKIEFIKEIISTLRISELFNVPAYLEGVTNLRGKIIAVINFGKFVLSSEIDAQLRKKFIIVQLENGKEAAIVADDIKEVIWIEPDTFQDVPDTINERERNYLMCIINTNEQPIPVIDIHKILEDECWKEISG